ncbi:MAG: asparagine synthase (glutamine-hydrolyzing) [Thaumarchaeota archaeon]|nr:asparagine synthase (glutamine-hydrolyzing) [Nitrososphaerota archaeon]
MCGICGVFGFRGDDLVSRSVVEDMNLALHHRGPDEGGVYANRRVGLGISRLRIIDLASGSQPMFSEDRSKVIVFNGEIYNYRELRADLEFRGHKFATNSDTESIIHLYEEFGTDCVQHLNGMFAFAIWDEKTQTLFVARDRLGIKPLYYFEAPNYVAFASELKSLLVNSEIPREIDLSSLDKYLALRYIPAPYTIYKGIKKLPAGCYLVCSPETFKVERYWDLDFPVSVSGQVKKEEEYVKDLQVLLEDAVRLQMVSDVPLGAFLSGGIDSSCIVGLMAEQLSTPVTFPVT